MNDDAPTNELQLTEPAPAASSPLLLRLLSALVLAVVAIGATWAGPLPFAVLATAIALIVSWEWSHLVRGVELDLAFSVQALAVMAASALTAFGYAALALVALAIGTVLVMLIEFGRRPIVSALGVVYAGFAAVALIWLRASPTYGLEAVLLVLSVAAAADTAAFAAGRTIGGPRLAPAISPNKTWSGLFGAILAGGAMAAAFAYVLGGPVVTLTLYGLVMGLFAQIGDLAESGLKRAFGAKDASNLIPGHGGFMDRVDGVIVVAVLSALIALFTDPQSPAAALLFRP